MIRHHFHPALLALLLPGLVLAVEPADATGTGAKPLTAPASTAPDTAAADTLAPIVIDVLPRPPAPTAGDDHHARLGSPADDHGSHLLPPEFGPRDELTALSSLARIKQQTGEYEEALDAWEQVLDGVRDRHGRWDQRNVDALAGLAAAHRELGQLQEALEHYAQAVYINRMNQGLHDTSQVAYLNRITELHALRGEWEEATQLQEYALYVQERRHGDSDPDVLPALYQMAEWYERTGAFLSARSLYERAVDIVESGFGDDDIRLVEPLRKLARTYRMERFPPAVARREEPSFRITSGGPPPDLDPHGQQFRALNPYRVGERALERSVEIQLANPEVDGQERAEALIELGDWFLLFDKWNQAMSTYAQARDVLREAGWEEERIAREFDEPVALVFPIPPPPGPSARSERIRSQEGYIDMVYDVTDRGRLRNLDIAAADPEGLIDFRVQRSARAARFRPRFLDDEPVAAERVSQRHSFVYYAEAPEPEYAEAPEQPEPDGI